MCPVIDQPGYVVLGHFWKLLLKYAFKARQNDETLSFVVVINDSEFDLAIALLNDCGLDFKKRQPLPALVLSPEMVFSRTFSGNGTT